MLRLSTKMMCFGVAALVVALIGVQNANAITPYLISGFLENNYISDDSSIDFSKQAMAYTIIRNPKLIITVVK